MSMDVKSGNTFETVTTSQIYEKLRSHCARCHTPSTPLGGFVVTSPGDFTQPGGEGFATKAEEALWHIRSDGTTPFMRDEVMPPFNSPEGKPWSVRVQSPDDIVKLASWLDLWLKAGTPPSFTVPVDPGDVGSSTYTYLMAPAVGNGLTNLGNCVPDKALVGSDEATMVKLDAMFAALQRADASQATSGEANAAQRVGLPAHLSETDLTTFDGAILARSGVIAFVPQYPLWSDDAGKLRHVRVPRGTSIHFDKATQQFEIPRDTRFYKTFLKRIVDTDGNESWRKIETRLIVARPDPDAPLSAPQLDTTKINALFGMYRWNDDETEATLVDEPLNDDEGFKDVVLTYDTDVNLAARIRAENPDPDRAERALASAHAVRHYAMPSSQRCIQCHMGSASRDFVLGFRPVQIRHRPIGEGGVIEPSGPDELTQLQRLIDYGVITGIDSPADILPLESLEGDRKPRNSYELAAQGYMLGNCAHCHNPHGFPSVSFPQLIDVVNFQPGPSGGIFQFPLEAFSPRIARGIAGDVKIAYITPSLVDHPSYPPGVDPNDPQQADFWRPKWLQPGEGHTPPPSFVYAPWRSLIYRNVDTPFAYSDDFAIYPHMPMNTPGYDVRAKRILGDWMVSIPAARKRSDIPEYRQPYPDPLAPTVADDSSQPYVEVPPGDPGYDAAVAAAEARLATFHSGTQPFEAIPPNSSSFYEYRGRYAASMDTTDIVDPEIDGLCSLVPIEKEVPTINVPTHPHWVPLDLTQQQGTWVPRRSDWKRVLGDRQIDPPVDVCGRDPSLITGKYEDLKHVVGLLQGRSLDEVVTVDGAQKTFREFALTEVPMGLWQDKPECDWSKGAASKIPTLDEMRATDPRPWMNIAATDDGTRHVYSQVPGATVFNMICINCHGPKFDSVGRLAENLATMTGGNARVADLRDGLFGPVSDPMIPPGSNRSGVFAEAAAQDGATVDDWGARYMSFMALGGTGATIPSALLTNVSRTLVFGESRAAMTPPRSANMLSIVRELCMETLRTDAYHFGVRGSPVGYFDPVNTGKKRKQLWHSGDAEMWLRLCSIDNPPPVQAYHVTSTTSLLTGVLPIDPNALANHEFPPSVASAVTGLYAPPVLKRCAYEPDHCGAPGVQSPATLIGVGDEKGVVSASLTADNLHPWCVLETKFLDQEKLDTEAFFRDNCVAGADCLDGRCSGADCVKPPRCPVGATKGDQAAWDDEVGTAADEWALKGAMNAGLAVFLYLDSVVRNGGIAKPTYDHCEQLAP